MFMSSGSVFMENSTAMQIFSNKVIRLWNICEVRVMVLLSLSLQLILVIFGCRRKYIARRWIEILVWLAYVSADMVATVALGNIAKNQSDSGDTSGNSNNFIQAFWAPFLLMHLGGPDTITAYSLEDNELWLRHLLGLGVQFVVAFYIFVKSWANNPFTFLAIPILVSGIIKYGERNWVLKSSSTENTKKSLLSVPVTLYSFLSAPFGCIITEQSTTRSDETLSFHDPDVVLNRANQSFLQHPFILFKMSTYLFQDLILGSRNYVLSRRILLDKQPQQAFEMIETELSFMFDMLYTKASVVYSRLGIFLRSISFLSSFSVLLAFSVHVHTHKYPSIADIGITFSLLVAAVILEVHSFISFLHSDWTKLWLDKREANDSNQKKQKKWSRSMGQHSIVHSEMVEKHAVSRIKKVFGINNQLLKHWNADWTDVNDVLKEWIFQRLKGMDRELGSAFSHDYSALLKEILGRRGDAALKRKLHVMNIPEDDHMTWCTSKIALDHSVILWHIATDICFFSDHHSGLDCSHVQTIKGLSDYMLFLFLFRPSMCPKGIREFNYRYEDACKDVKKFVSKEKYDGERDVCNALLTSEEGQLEGMKVLKDATLLAKKLINLRSPKKTWELLAEIWLEMLIYTASHCEWKEHAQQLRSGGELITHVCLLMAHIGISEQYQQLDLSVAEQRDAAASRSWAREFF